MQEAPPLRAASAAAAAAAAASTKVDVELRFFDTRDGGDGGAIDRGDGGDGSGGRGCRESATVMQEAWPEMKYRGRAGLSW